MRGMVNVLRSALLVATAGLTMSATPLLHTLISAGDFSGSRAVGSGLINFGGAAGAGAGIKVDWLITYNNVSGLYTYKYTVGNTLPGRKGNGLSHVIFDLSDNCPTVQANNACATGIEYAVADQRFYEAKKSGNPNLPIDFFGVKFNTPGAVYPQVVSFTSERAPRWGHFYFKLGQDEGWNTGMTNLTSGDKIDFIATPDTKTGFIPEPGTWALMVSGAGLLAFFRRKA